MNKTLLIIICDFLLISILALVEFNPSVEESLIDQESLRENATEEMLELLQLSLEHESSQRKEVEETLDSTLDELGKTKESLEQTSSNLDDTRESLAQTQEEKEALASSLEETMSSLQLTLEDKKQLETSLNENRRQSQQLQQELVRQQELANKREQDLEAARTNLEDLETQQQQMSTELQILDTEKQMLQQNLIAARAEVERARIEAERAQARSEELAAGVSELAASSSALEVEIRQSQALSMSAVYQQFEDNRVFIRFEWDERSAFTTVRRESALQSILVRSDSGIHALFAVANTPLSSSRTARPNAFIKVGDKSFEVTEVGFLKSDRRIASVQVPVDVVNGSGITVFNISQDPLKFSTAVLIKDDQEKYGEIPVRIPPGEPGLLEVETRLFSRLFGEFSPNSGDYVFSLSGELTGIMVQAERALIIQSPEFGDFYRLK